MRQRVLNIVNGVEAESFGYCADYVRRLDEDRWLSAHYARPDMRRRLHALYALHLEIERAPSSVSEAALGEIRLQWWREAVAEARETRPARAHPAVIAAQAARILDDEMRDAIGAAIDARARLLYPEPFRDVDELIRWLKIAEGSVAVAAARFAGPLDAALEEPLLDAAAAFALARSGRRLAPQLAGEIPARAREAFADASMRLRTLPAEAAPAALHFSLTPAYLAGGPPSPLAKRWRLFTSMMSGRLSR